MRARTATPAPWRFHTIDITRHRIFTLSRGNNTRRREERKKMVETWRCYRVVARATRLLCNFFFFLLYTLLFFFTRAQRNSPGQGNCSFYYYSHAPIRRAILHVLFFSESTRELPKLPVCFRSLSKTTVNGTGRLGVFLRAGRDAKSSVPYSPNKRPIRLTLAHSIFYQFYYKTLHRSNGAPLNYPLPFTNTLPSLISYILFS